MEGTRWSTLSPLLDELLELTGHSRARRLAQIEGSDPDLAKELENLMALEEERPDFMSQPVVDASLFAAQANQEIGPYRLVEPIGEGGMGQVWLAVRADGLYERRVALKLLRPGLGDVGLHARFTRERQILARLGHAHIARLLDAGISQDGQPYLALDYVRGDPITDYAQKRALDVRTRLQLFAQVCAAVSHAHANLVVHRDLKPSNILVTSSGEVCLLDFGIAKLLDQQDQTNVAEITRTGSRTFTLHYAAPEQLRGEIITTMTDVYALGVVLYELLTDCKPYGLVRPSDAAWEEAILGGEPGRPSQVAARMARDSGSIFDKRRARALAGDLDNIVLKALSKIPEQRYASVEALAQDLRRHLDGQPVHARAQSFGYRARKYLRRHIVGLAVGGAITGMLAVSLAIVSWQASKALKEASRAQAMQDFVIGIFEGSGSPTGEGLDVRALLDAGVTRADSELASQPQARAELIGLIARLRSGLGDDEQALQLLDRQQPVLDAMGDSAPANLRLDSAALRGHGLRELGRNQECLDKLGRSLALAQDAADSYPLPAAEFFSQLGRCHAALNGRAVARDLFGQALQLRKAHAGASALPAESENDLAMLQLADGRADLALRGLREALGHLRYNGGEQNALGAEIWSGLGATFKVQDNIAEAEAAYRQALNISLARFGASHPRTSTVQSSLAAVLMGAGKLAESEQLLSQSQDSLLARWGSNSERLATHESLRGIVALERDQPEASEALLADAIRIWRSRGAMDGHAWDLCHLAQAQTELARDAQAEANRNECLALLDAQPQANAVPAMAALVQAALDRNDTVRARAWFAQIPADKPRDGPELTLVRARLAQLSGDADAGQQITAALAQLPDDRKHRRLRWQALSMQAAQLCLGGQRQQGAAMRDRIVSEMQLMEPEHRRQQRRLALLSAPCSAKG